MSIFSGNVLLDTIGIIISVVILIYSYFQWKFGYWKRRNVPFMKMAFFLDSKQPVGDTVAKVADKARSKGWRYFGTFLVGNAFFVPLDLELVKCILTKDFNHFTDRGVYYNERDDPLSAHLFALEGHKWRNLRAKLSPAFTSGKLKGMFQTLLDCSSQLDQFLKEQNSKEPIDIKHALVSFTMNVIGSCAFGIECNSFKEPNSPFMEYGNKIFKMSILDQFLSMMALSFPTLATALHYKMIPTDVSKFFYEAVSKTVSHRESNNQVRNDFLQLLINIKNNEGDEVISETGNEVTLSMNEIAAQCFLFFLAGYETSSTTATFALFELALNPGVQEKVREELFKVLKNYDNKISYDAINELTYMQQVVDETLRKYSALPFTNRQCVKDYKIPDSDIILEKGTKVLIPVKSIQLDENIYKNPQKFDPERFNAEEKRKRHPYSFIPFGEGPRICIGMRFGLMQSKVALASVLKNFRIKLNSKTKMPLEMDPRSFIPSTKEGIWLDLESL